MDTEHLPLVAAEPAILRELTRLQRNAPTEVHKDPRPPLRPRSMLRSVRCLPVSHGEILGSVQAAREAASTCHFGLSAFVSGGEHATVELRRQLQVTVIAQLVVSHSNAGHHARRGLWIRFGAAAAAAAAAAAVCAEIPDCSCELTETLVSMQAAELSVREGEAAVKRLEAQLALGPAKAAVSNAELEEVKTCNFPRFSVSSQACFSHFQRTVLCSANCVCVFSGSSTLRPPRLRCACGPPRPKKRRTRFASIFERVRLRLLS